MAVEFRVVLRTSATAATAAMAAAAVEIVVDLVASEFAARGGSLDGEQLSGAADALVVPGTQTVLLLHGTILSRHLGALQRSVAAKLNNEASVAAAVTLSRAAFDGWVPAAKTHSDCMHLVRDIRVSDPTVEFGSVWSYTPATKHGGVVQAADVVDKL